MNCKGMAFFPTNFMLQTPHEDAHHPASTTSPHLLTSWFPQDFHGVASTTLLGKRSPSSMSFAGFESCEQHQQEPSNTGDDELSSDDIDGSSAQAMLLGERKKRLSIEQVKTLEKSFELQGNKLEPERKLQLAKALGLQPRQVAIWFQNRRARWKTKQLEKDYDLLKRQFDAVKADNDALQSQNRKLHAEILALKGRDHPSHEPINLNKETEGCGSNRSSENSSDLKLNFSTRTPPSSITEHETEHHHHHHQIPTSRQLFPPSGLTNMFPGIDDQSGFWPWLEQHQHLNN